MSAGHLIPEVIVLQRIGGSTWIIWLALCCAAHGQDRLEPTTNNPGARSLGLGGAFVAIADDATAAYANPAGLVQLLRPEISVEVSARSYRRNQPGSTRSGIGFGSYVLPVKRWSFAIYAQTLADIEFPGGTDADTGTATFFSDLALFNGGLSAGVTIGESISLGLGLTYTVGSYASTTYSSLQEEGFLSIDSSRDQWGIIGGLLWTFGDEWALGLSYRSGADFDFEDGTPSNGGVTASLPQVTAAGVRWRSTDGRLTVAVEVEQLSGSRDRIRTHLGGEWVFLTTSPLIGVRAGIWNDPGFEIRAEDIGAVSPAENLVHGSAGVGVAFRKIQLDFGIDISEVVSTVSLSAIFSF